MRLRSLLLVVALAVAALVVSPTPAAAIDSSCEATDTGYSCLYGPLEVRKGMNSFAAAVDAPPAAGFVTSLRATLLDDEGYTISHHMAHLHHAVWLDPTRYDMTCPTIPTRFFATGKERTKMQMPPGFGYYWSNQPPLDYQYPPTWVMIADIDGMHAMVHELYIRLNIGFTPAEPTAMTSVEPVWLDVRNCSNDPVFDVPRRPDGARRFRESWDYAMPAAGNFVTMGGHLHDGGIKLELENTTTGAEVFTSEGIYGNAKEPWYLTAMSAYSSAPGIPVAADDVLRLTAVYNATHRLNNPAYSWRDVMGIMVGYLAPATS